LHHLNNLGLFQPGFFADAHYEIAFGQGHRQVLDIRSALGAWQAE
jgi:hypothetical protein